MGWQDQGGDPWGSKQAPDLQETIEKIKKSIPFKFSFGGKYGIFPVIVIVAVLVWLLSGIYVVKPEQIGVVKRFGKAVRTTMPGPHYHLPVPIETVLKPAVTQVRRIEIGFRSIGDRQNSPNRAVLGESLMLTRAENIVNLTFIVQYRISDPIQYLFNVKHQEKTVKDAAEASMRQVVGDNNIDDILTTGKFQIQQDTKKILQDILDSYDAGVQVLAVQLQDVHPPQQVMAAFKDVASAKEDKAKMINEAHGYRNEILPKSKGKAAQIVNDAIAYKESKIITAQGDASRFEKILSQYKSARDVTRKRLYLEMMEEILPDMEKVIIEDKVGGNMLPHLSLDAHSLKPLREE
ncbi:MAG: FtsH protease activity modulator HflK [Syntrophales bacterium]|jgi:membrane protease subunit HflK|nr:FtsH protease activity modulator HflK [Syntrophales bacterium]MDY0045567.1 FtsH protease activity modulator HflK [Syntrophales bacterium]